ncbi:MAG TPA: hypothetical protein DIV98_00870 [Oceanicaulis sp.]|jgi:hypothetical protein|nr:hypothetical protein [Pusillimonas sp.]MBG35417.1 hypothetical protein [Oceanicaulis sp.]MBL4537299.1 hypothetical protein [Oceanicaulis sp.]HCR93473.1 hypothetical protein [Oceanicaulis sp.]|tara:strand:- start:26 stop:208 length:183 start_codon:yes stop_codon:yes gene_type:complete
MSLPEQIRQSREMDLRQKVRDAERELAGLSCFDPNYLGTLSKLNTLKRRLQLYAPQDVAA